MMRLISLQEMPPFPNTVGELQALCRRLGEAVDRRRAPLNLEFHDARSLWTSFSAESWATHREGATSILLRTAFEWVTRVAAQNVGKVYFADHYPLLAEHVEPNTGVVIVVVDVAMLVTDLPLLAEDEVEKRPEQQFHGVTGHA